MPAYQDIVAALVTLIRSGLEHMHSREDTEWLLHVFTAAILCPLKGLHLIIAM